MGLASELTPFQGTKVQPMQRKAYSTSGKETEVLTNAWPITKFPTKPVYQYEVSTFGCCYGFYQINTI